MKKVTTVLFFILFTSSTALFAVNTSGISHYKGTLDGTWTFYWNELLSTESKTAQGEKVTVPATWHHPKFGYGTYCKEIIGLDPETTYAFMMNESPGTACSAFVNGKYISSCGVVSTTRQSKACCKPWFVPFKSDANGRAVIAIQVSNWVYRKAGIWGNVYFGEAGQIKRDFDMRAACSAFVIGMVFFLFIVNMLLFLFNHERKDSLLFAIIALMMVARLLTAEFSLLLILFPSFPYSLARKLEYLLIWGGPPMFLYLLDILYPELKINSGAYRCIPLSSLLIGIVCSCLPLSIACYFVTPIIWVAFVIIIWVAYRFISRRNEVHGPNKKQLKLLFFILLIVAFGLFLSWALIVTNKSLKFSLIPAFFMLFSLLQFLNLSSLQSKLFYSRMEKSQELQKLNNAYARFVPQEFLRTLHKNDVTEVRLGDNAEVDMSIVFFMLDKQESREEQFNSLASFSEQAVQIISDHHGYLSKFINRGIMALFPYSAKDAVQCALELKITAQSIGIERVGCGIHYGRMIVGTIGEENRLDDTVISDTVNTAFRIMEYACEKGISVVASRIIVQQVLEKESLVQFEKLGEIPVKGKREPVLMYSCASALVQKEEAVSAKREDVVK